MSSPSSPAATPGERPSPRGGFVRRIPLGLLIVAGAALVALNYAESSDAMSPANAFLAKFSVVGLTSILLFLWFVFLSAASRSVRFRTAVVGIVLLAATIGAVRIEGVNGDVMPRLRFRWLPHADEMLPKFSADALNLPSVNLLETTPHDYPQFMGPNRRATLEGINLARDWKAAPPKELWKQPIGAAWSGFAIVNHFAITQEQRGEEELISCYDVDTGKLLWAHSTPGRFFETLAGIGPRATPTIDQGKVYALGAKGRLSCLDGATGKPLWEHDVVTENGATIPIWGKSCSPLVLGNKVIVSAGAHDGKSLIAYDKQTGEEIWHAGDNSSSYSSPELMTLCGVQQVVMVNHRDVVAHDPETGKVLWEHPWPNEEVASPNVSQPVAIGDDRVFLSKGYGVGSTVWQIAHPGDEWKVEPVWKTHNMKTKFANVVLRDGYAYGLDEGTLSCIDLATGAKKWKQGRYGHGQIMLVDDLILVQAEAGDVALVEAQPKKFVELARITGVSGTNWNTPALSGNKLLVRSNEEAACYELPVASP